MFKLLKNIGVELSSYHGGSLNGKDIKKVMNNTVHIFGELAAIMKEGKRPASIMFNADVNVLCLHFQELFVLWDGVFLLARTVSPMEQDTKSYLRYVLAAVHGNDALRCTVTPKVHMMLKHATFQMRYIRGGLGDKMEDWVEQLHQTGMCLRQGFCTVQNPVIRTLAGEKVNSRSLHPDVIAYTSATNAGNKRSYSVMKVEDAISTRRKRQHELGRYEAMIYFDKEVKIKKLKWSVIFDDVKSTDERRCLVTSKIGPASGPCSPTATSEGSLATAALDGVDDGVPPSSSSSHPPHARLHILPPPPPLPPPHFCPPPSPAVPPLPPPPPALGYTHMVEAGGISEGGRATASGEDMDGALADCGGRGEKRAEARRQRRWRRPRHDMNKILNWGVFLGVLVSD